VSRPTLPRYGDRVNEKWRDKAECNDEIDRAPVLINVWRSPQESTDDYAQEICETVCKVREECLVDAVTDPYAEGLRGGFKFDTGKVDQRDVNKIRSIIGTGYRIRTKRTKRDETQPDQEV
jgi:hypothetical protein